MGRNVKTDIMYSCKEISILGRRVISAICQTEDGINILIAGGDKGHIGAVAIAKAGYIIESVAFPDHKEKIICENWAKKISVVYPGPVVVEAGIHYDTITKEQIQEVLERLDEELEKLLQEFSGEKERIEKGEGEGK